ncbi:MAG: histidine--tRNA ligase [Candidatus Shapirobacteria bacterium]|jgi:histidyl-tRNA synthetase
MNQLIQPVKGTRDFYPEDQAFQTWFFQKVREVSETFGFQEYNGPFLEPLELYAAKSGEELVKKQAFTLTDQSGKILALRPEMTPTLARMIAQKDGELTFPVKWWTYGSRYRYEKPQKGRGREFFQWDCDIIGTDGFEADAEAIAIAATMYRKLGLTSTDVKIKINDRQLLQGELLNIGVPENLIVNVFRIADKKDKVTEVDFKEMLLETGLTESQTDMVKKTLEDKDLYKKSEWLLKIFDLLKIYGISDFVEFDPGIVRGLEYYTRTVFEGWDVNGEFRAIWGGGRYDNLVADVGSKNKVPGVGFAMGDMVIAEVLKQYKKYPVLSANKSKVLVTVFSPELFNSSLEVTNILRKNNINTEIYLNPDIKIDKQLKYADKKGIPYVIVLGPDEIKADSVTIKNMSSGTQTTVKKEDVVNSITPS